MLFCLILVACVFASSYRMLFILSLRLESIGRKNCRGGNMPLGRELPTCLVEVRCSPTIAKKADDDDDDGWRRVQFFVLINSLFAVILFGEELLLLPSVK